MTPNARIALNVAATYGRSLFALVCGLLTGRWLLMVLGDIDYGLYGLVAGLTAFVTFFSSFLSGAIARYYAFAVGEAQVSGREAEGLAKCRQWFNTAVLVHTVVPGAVMLVGYPVGAYAVEHWLTIPAERIGSCLWVLRFVCLSSLVGLVNVPFNAMYVAKQYIAELTVYSFAQTLCNVVALYYMVTHPGDWLATYAGLVCLFGLVPQLLIVLRALKIFPECRLDVREMRDWGRIRSLFAFAGWQFFGNFGALIKSQGISILVNKTLGPRLNTTLAVGSTVASQTDQLAGSLNGALVPALTNLAGAGERDRLLRMVYRACKLGAILSLFFILPLSLEVDAVLALWLKTPPALAAEACLLLLATTAVDETARGIGIAVTAYGRIALYYALLGGLNILSLPMAWLAVRYGWLDLRMVLAVLLAVRVVAVVASARLAQHVMGISFLHWFTHVFCHVALAAGGALLAGWGTRALLADFYWLRMLPTFAVTTVVFLALAWRLVLEADERAYLVARLRRLAAPALDVLRDARLWRRWRAQWRRAAKTADARRRSHAAQRGGDKALVVPCDPWGVVGSRGDQAMILACVQHVRARHPGRVVDVLTDSAATDAACRAAGLRPVAAWNEPIDTWFRARVADYAEVYVLGADVTDGVYGWPTAMKMLAYYDCFARAGVETHYLGFSWSLTPSPMMAKALRALAPGLPLFVRDPVSLERLERFTRHRPLVLVADAAFGLVPRTSARVKGWQARVAAAHAEGKIVIALNAHPMFNDVDATSAAWEAAFAAVLARVQDRHSEILYALLPHDDRVAVSDLEVLRRLAATLGEGRAFLVDEVMDADEIKAFVGACDGLVAGRMHLSIAAFGGGVPVLGLAYQGKFEGLWRHFGLDGATLLAPRAFLDDPAAAEATVERFVANLRPLAAQIASFLPAVLALSRRNFCPTLCGSGAEYDTICPDLIGSV